MSDPRDNAPSATPEPPERADALRIALDDGRVIVLPGAALRFAATHASGPGGQNVNKVATKVELRFDVATSDALTFYQKGRITERLANRMADGVLIITSQLTRNRLRNVEDARQKLAALIAEALFVQKTRTPTRPSRGQKARRLDEKRQQSARKGSRGAVRGWDD
jgi:ribosome-associated protein